MADNANKMGTSMEMIQSAYQGFAKQNYTMLDNLKLGYGGTKTEMERLLKDAEALSGIHYEIGNFADMTAAIHVVQENLGIAGTSAKEASETVSGSLNAMKSAWANLIVGMGDSNADMKALMNNFVKTAEIALKNLIPVILESLNGIGELITQLTPIIVEKLPELIQTLIPQFINVVIQLANAIIQNLPLILTTILQGLVQALPTFIQAVVQTLPTLIIAIVDFLTNPDNIGLLVDAAIQLFMGLVMAVPQILGGLMEAFGKLVGNLWDGLTRMFGEFAGNFGNFIGGIFKGAINGVITFIEGFINLPIDTLNGFIGIINGAFGWIGVNLGYIDRIRLPRLAKGGVVDGIGTDTSDSNLYALSKGEYVIRASAAREIGYENLNRMNETGEISGGGQTNYFTINGYNKSPEELATIISRKIAFNQRGVLG
jgi:phage-related protein